MNAWLFGALLLIAALIVAGLIMWIVASVWALIEYARRITK